MSNVMATSPWNMQARMLIKLLLVSCWLGVGLSVKTLPFWLDSYLNCTGPIRLIYKNERAIIHGQGAIESRESPQDCDLTLKTENNFERTYFRIQIKQVLIKECTVTFTIYDREVSQTPLDSFDCKKGKGRYEFIHTVSDTAVFQLKRDHLRDIYYDIEIIVTPLVVSDGPGWENDFGRDEGIYPEKFPNEAILGIVGAALGVSLIVIVGVAMCCYRRHKAKHGVREEHKVGFTNTGISFEPKGNLSDASMATWSTDMRSTQPRVPMATRLARPSEDADSVFDKESTYKGRPIAVDSLQRLTDSSRSQRRGFDRRDHNRLRGREAALDRSRDDSYADDDSFQEERSPKLFVERILTSRVKVTPRKWDLKEEEDNHEEQDGPDDGSQHYSDEDEDVEEEDTEEEEVTDKKMDVSEMEESEDEEEEEEEEEESDGNEMPPDYRNATLDISSASQPRQPVAQPQHKPQHTQPRELPQEHFPTPQQPQYIPQYMMYPGAAPPNQFMTAPPSSNQYIPAQPGYSQSGPLPPPSGYSHPGTGQGQNQYPSIPTGHNQLQPVPTGQNQYPPIPTGHNQYPSIPTGQNQYPSIPTGHNQFQPVPAGSVPQTFNVERGGPVDREAQPGRVPLGAGWAAPVTAPTRASQGADQHETGVEEPDPSSWPQLDPGVELFRR